MQVVQLGAQACSITLSQPWWCSSSEAAEFIRGEILKCDIVPAPQSLH